MGIDTHDEPVVYMRADCSVCRSEGFEARSRVAIRSGERTITATLNVVHGDLLEAGWAGLSEVAWRLLAAEESAEAMLGHAEPRDSFGAVRGKLHGKRFSRSALGRVIADVAARRYTDVEISAFLSACAGRLDDEEIIDLTRAMLESGARLSWDSPVVVDKHCIGGLPGNRTTPIVVAIAAAAGLVMPKTSSRSITSPAGTADTMEQLAPVDLDLDAIRRVVSETGGCVAWGGAVRLSPADDVLIRVERALDIDTEGQLVASVLSKKAAAGSTHVLIDIPTGPTAKVRSAEHAARLAELMKRVGAAIGLRVATVVSDGRAPVGRGIGPALEARDVLAVLRRDPAAPRDLRERAILLAGLLLELGDCCPAGEGETTAAGLLDDGYAEARFVAICEAQGGLRVPVSAPLVHVVKAPRAGTVAGFDNRLLSRAAKLAGAPGDPSAGIDLRCAVGSTLATGEPMFEVHSGSPGELAYALAFVEAHPALIELRS
jgi:thymidine phosphorylase